MKHLTLAKHIGGTRFSEKVKIVKTGFKYVVNFSLFFF